MYSRQSQVLPDGWSMTIIAIPSASEPILTEPIVSEPTREIDNEPTSQADERASVQGNDTPEEGAASCIISPPIQQSTPRHEYARLGVFSIGQQRMALLLSEIAAVVPLAELCAITDVPPWIVGMVAHQEVESYTPVVDLAELWEDTSLDGPWTHIILTRAGIALGASNYYVTPMALRLVPFRPAPGRQSVHRAALVGGSPVVVLDPRFVVRDAPAHR